jgi:hypothetical protein
MHREIREIAERIRTGLRLPDGDLLDLWVVRESASRR